MDTLSEKNKTATFKIAVAGNTINPALLILQNKGYEIGLEPNKNENEYETWWAEKENRLFIANDALTLLGLVSIWENRGENWQTKENELWLIDKFYNLNDQNES